MAKFKIFISIFIFCILLNEFINASPLQTNSILNNDQTKLINSEQNGFIVSDVDMNRKDEKITSLKDEDSDEDNDKKEEKNDKKEDKPDEKDDDKDDKKEEKVEEKKDDDDDKDDKNDDKNDEKKDEKKEEKKEDEKDDDKKDDKKIDEKLDDNQKKTEKQAPQDFDDSSQEDDSHSNPDTEEVGESESESDEDDKNEEKEPAKGKLDKKLLIILASGFRYDYVHIQKADAIKEILKSGVFSSVIPVFPSNSYPNYYSLMTGLHPIKHGFMDDEMYDVKYKEDFPGKGKNHKHWYNKVEPLWITAMNNKIKIGTYWWKGACGVTIKGRTPKNCVPYKEKVSNSEVSKQLESIVDQFNENKLDLALLSYEEIDNAGHEFGPQSHKLRKAVRKFDKILADLLKNIDEKNLEEKINIVIVSDHGMTENGGEKIDIEKFLDFNDVEQFVNTGTFAMILPEANKIDFVFNLLRNAKIEGLNVYKKPDFPANFNFGKGENELLLPIVLTTDNGYIIQEPSVEKNDGNDSDDDDDSPKKGLHGYHPVHVKWMNSAMFGTGPDFERNRVVNPINAVDLYNVFCKLLKIKPLKNDGNKEIIDDFIHDADSEEHEEDNDEQNNSDEDSGNVEESYLPSKKKNDNRPVYRSRWTLRGGSQLNSLNLPLQFLTLSLSLILIRFI